MQTHRCDWLHSSGVSSRLGDGIGGLLGNIAQLVVCSVAINLAHLRPVSQKAKDLVVFNSYLFCFVVGFMSIQSTNGLCTMFCFSF